MVQLCAVLLRSNAASCAQARAAAPAGSAPEGPAAAPAAWSARAATQLPAQVVPTTAPGTVAYPHLPEALVTAEPVPRAARAAASASSDTALGSADPPRRSNSLLLAWLVPLLAACAVCAVAVAVVVARRPRVDAFQHMFSFHDGLERRESYEGSDAAGSGLEALPAEALVKGA